MSSLDYISSDGRSLRSSQFGKNETAVKTGSAVRFNPSNSSASSGLHFGTGAAMAENYKEFDKSDTSPIIPEIRLSRYTFRVREVILAGVSVAALIVCLVLVAVLATNGSTSGSANGGTTSALKQANSPCLEFPCLKSASYAVSNMNTSIDPCQNFHQYACGNFPSQNPLNPETSQRTVFFNIFSDNEDKLRNILEAPAGRSTSWSSEQKLKDFFQSCLDDYGKMNAGGKTFINKIVDPLGGWYVLGNQRANWNFQTALQKTSIDFWTAALFTFRVTTDQYNWRNRVIEIDLAGIGMYWSYFIRDSTSKIRDDYKNFIRTVGKLLVRDSGLPISDADRDNRLEIFVNDTFDIEYNLANITANTLPSGDPHNHENRITITDLTQQTNNVIDFVTFFTYTFGSVVTGSTRIVVRENDWLRRMLTYVGSIPPADRNRKLQNYLIWRLAQSYVQELNWDYIHASREFYVAQYGVAEFLGTWRHCFYLMDQKMPDALGSLFVRGQFIDPNKDKAEEIVKYVKNALLASIEQNTIMDDDTKTKAKQKIQQSTDKMGYPDIMLNDDEIDNIYNSVTVNKSDYFQNLLEFNKFEKADWTRRLTTGEDRSIWLYNTYDTSMTFYNLWNQLLVPAGMLQFPLYEWTLPHYMNFGSMGGLMGHYLVHAIDTWGGFYSAQGDYGNWWSNATTTNYQKAKTCFADVFGNKTMGPFKVEGQTIPQTVQVNGDRFAWEGMAETTGVRIAFEAYKQWTRDNPPEKTAPSINRNNDQMFFLSFAQTYCFSRTDALGFQYANGQRVPEDIRVNTALSLLKEFTDAYSCPAGSPMNSDTKCDMF